MSKEIGLWIDHSEAVIVTISDDEEVITAISSRMGNTTRFSGGSGELGAAEDLRDRRYDNHLNKFYDAVVELISDADAIQLYGPGEAKGELEKRLERKELAGRIVHIETTDKMTNRQIAAKVRGRLRRRKSL